MQFIKFAATTTRDRLRDIVEARGSRNADDVQNGSDIYAAGSLVLRGFEGSCTNHKDEYKGYIVCRRAQPADDDSPLLDFCELPVTYDTELTVTAE